MAERTTLVVLTAFYDCVSDAEQDYEALRSVSYGVDDTEAWHAFDAAVIDRSKDGIVRVAKTHEQPTRNSAARGFGWGLVVGAALAIFSPIGLLTGLVVAGGGGALIGAVTGHLRGGLGDLNQLGAVLEAGQASLIVVCASKMADQVWRCIHAEDRYASKEFDGSAAELARQIKAVKGQ